MLKNHYNAQQVKQCLPFENGRKLYYNTPCLTDVSSGTGKAIYTGKVVQSEYDWNERKTKLFVDRELSILLHYTNAMK